MIGIIVYAHIRRWDLDFYIATGGPDVPQVDQMLSDQQHGKETVLENLLLGAFTYTGTDEIESKEETHKMLAYDIYKIDKMLAYAVYTIDKMLGYAVYI